MMTAAEKAKIAPAFRAAFPYTVPIFLGFWFLGLTYGIYMNVSGFAWYYPTIMSLVIFGGSLEFIAVGLLMSAFAPLTTLLVAIMVQARHLFYGIAMLDEYRDAGWMRPCLVFGLCDETFAINQTAEIPPGVDRQWFYFCVTALVHFYWVLGSTMGGLFGSLLAFDTTGLSFVMTALFVVIFLDQWLKEPVKWPAIVGFVSSAACLALFGADGFMLPTMGCMVVALTFMRGPYERRAARVAPPSPGATSKGLEDVVEPPAAPDSKGSPYQEEVPCPDVPPRQEEASHPGEETPLERSIR